jgi:hypothetical protein
LVNEFCNVIEIHQRGSDHVRHSVAGLVEILLAVGRSKTPFYSPGSVFIRLESFSRESIRLECICLKRLGLQQAKLVLGRLKPA